MTNEEALRHFRRVCENAYAEQDRLLLRLMHRNKDTEYGKRYSFGSVHNCEEYARYVPLGRFADYDGCIARIVKGERNIITADPPVFYNISAGSTGEPKYVPLTREDIEKQHIYEDLAVSGMIKEALPEYSDSELFGCIFNLGDFFLTRMDDGVMNGVRSGAYFRTAKEEGTFDGSVFCVPDDVMFPESLCDMLYPKLRFALANRDITAIHGVFVHRTVGIFRYIENHWEELLNDIEKGTVSDSFALSGHWLNYILEKLPPDPQRAAELRCIARETLADGMLRKLWKKLRYIRVIDGKLFGAYSERFRRYAEDIPVHCFAYASSESNIGIAPRMGVTDEYVLLPDVCFFEFIPEEQMSAPRDILTFRDVQAGKRYETVITTLSGLYRYRIGDVVEVTGKYGEAPAVKVCYRKDLVISLSDERMNLMQFETAMSSFCGRAGITAEGFCAAGNYDDIVPHYVVYIETPDELPDGAELLLDSCFCGSSLGYKGARKVGDLGGAGICPVKSGTFKRYERICWEKGRRTEQAKPLRILTDPGQILFFERAEKK